MCGERGPFHSEFQGRREPSLHRFLEYDARLAHRVRRRIRAVVIEHAHVSEAPTLPGGRVV
ncbi:hypothetical protein Aaci_2425 [Alicyclobacillus acidocaldarius subsp. acidocaldarius DSM 446]|uniref:Uncharacterized protein n=1 Tax=Alicyclobacillus acidocaldarius subsp. acidocaldarius (strain ATCC 27009 / DSM 446 / BCRC 14685 / JCM 5260 / KCTC 1825 / NBRC 15652 / NCIMB 11725 / NRRL B-14509 / 104-IA) TaxID=521098 RepID=C8WSE7_ALIAD|nr:hypothetical protein Aaci_2425 [Alicyclobacillus acidocaldarius subsp. acidocaldarius DSM 446]